MKNFIVGLKDYVRAQHLLYREGLWPLFLVPGILSLFYLPLSVIFGVLFLQDLTRYVHDKWVPDFLQSTVMLIFVSVFLVVVGLTLGYLLFRNVIMILYSPILSFLSDATERVADGKTRQEDAPRFSMKEAAHSAMRGTMMSLLTLVFSLLGLLTSFLIAMIPIIGAILAAIFIPLFTCYLAGVGFNDPLLERRKLSIAETLSFCWRVRGRVLGHGAGFTILLMVPVVGWFLAPSYGVVAGTLGAIEAMSRTKL